MTQQMQSSGPLSSQGNWYAHPISRILHIALTRVLKSLLEITGVGLPGKGCKDPQVITLIDDVRGAIIQYASLTWLSHSPAICEGMEDYIRATEVRLRAKHLHSESAQWLTIVTQAPPPVAVTAPLPQITSQVTILPRQITAMPVHTLHSRLQLKGASLSHSPATASLLFQPQSNPLASSTMPDAIIVERLVHSRKRTANVPEVSLSILFIAYTIAHPHLQLWVPHSLKPTRKRDRSQGEPLQKPKDRVSPNPWFMMLT